MIADKTNYNMRTRQSPEAREREPVAIGDFFGHVPKPKPTSKRTQTKIDAQIAIDARADAADKPKPRKRVAEKPVVAVYDYNRYEDLPARVRDLIEAYLAIEKTDAKAAGSLGFMTRALAIATLPHKRVQDHRFMRKNGDFTLTMLTAHPDGLPYGTLPRLLLTWVCSEAVRTGEPVLSLGPTLAAYLRELGLKNTGGARGDITRLKHAMTTLFSSIISCRYEGRDSWALQNVLLADRVEWWQPQDREDAGAWQSKLHLSRPFFKECVDHPVPVNLVAMKALRHSPLALDIYVWMTHRMSYLSKRTVIPWFSLSAQFGASYAQNDQGLRDFKRAFLRELKHVVTIYTEARISTSEHGLVLYPSPTHVPPRITKQQAILPFLD
ncbi:replication protein RepA [Mesorhizobium sp. J428]|nr:replication protein RepA [Mesorhizobium sp. J428]MCR5860175.1 plasmid encoded RepA protein [Mesorhizobium sp. J428]MCR5860209.1 plasmid encoded RepA protein [Mesorhizobium sp. J428]